MLRFGVGLFTFLALFIALSSAQYDPAYCPDGPTTGGSDPRWVFAAERFEILTEIISSGAIGELAQAFSTTRDSILLNIENVPVKFYWNFVTNERFEVLTSIRNNRTQTNCIRQVIAASTATSVITPGTLYVKPSVLLGFNARNQKNFNWAVRYMGNGTSRSFPTQIFQSCFSLTDMTATVAVTFHVLDQNIYPIASADNQIVPLQMEVNVLASTGKKESFIYNVFRLIPNPNIREERQALETPQGVYCPGRDTGLAVPENLPERVSSNTELAVPELGASIFSTHGLYDTEFEITRTELWLPNLQGGSDWQHLSEIHDFAVGLKYSYNYTNRQCVVDDILLNSTDAAPVDGKPNVIQINSPQHFFGMDDVQYQYTGEKPCRDRYICHVWIAQKAIPPNRVEQREWYWAMSINGQPLDRWFPVKYVLTRYLDSNLESSYEITIFNYRRNPATIFEVDYNLAECYRALGPANNYNLGVLSFKINNDQQYPVMSNLNYLRLHIFETLLFTLFIRPIRLSNLVVDKSGNDIIVTFTLLDAPPRMGPVEKLFNETTYDELVTRLDNIINSNGLAFRGRTANKQVVLRARANSLNVLHKSTNEKTVSSGPRITAFWIVFIAVGALVGAVAGMIVMGRMTSS